ncbi:MAG: hybrid sensor histidine kinase/response regulator, partial [Deltaproteobacteria bacterium]|nr:hybrid sensor histidine kinase/response regulator [Deltaproteobacteria bacterium]
LASSFATSVGFPQFAFHRFFEVFMLVQVSFPLSILIAVIRFNVFDIDRLISATASYTIAVAALVGVTFSAVPAAAAALSEIIGWNATSLQVPLAAGLVGLGLMLGRRLRPQVDRVFFPERAALQEGVARLLRDLAHCRSAAEVIQLVEVRVAAAGRPTRSTLLVRSPHAMVSADERHPGSPIALPLENPITRRLEADPSPLMLDESDDQTLAPLEAKLLLPLRSGNELAAIIVLGPKRSGDIYTATELTLLNSVCERASAALLSMRDAASLEVERSRGDLLEGAKSAAEQVNQSRARFLAAASHDLRQPLHALGLFASTLSERIREEDAPELVSRIQQSTASLSTMMDSLLDMSRLDAGAIEPIRSEFEIGPVIERLVSEFAQSAEDKGLVLEWKPTRERVSSDPVLLGRILQNLIGNAVRYTDSGMIVISCTTDSGAMGERVRIEVRDTGPGIPEDRQAEIFGEFTRVAGNQADGGLGLGLSIVDRMARLLGHDVNLESSPGSGSRFSISVDRAGPAMPSHEAMRVDFNGELVAVVDDNLEVLEGTGRLLEQWGCDTWLAQSMEGALESWENASRRPDALIVDYELGGAFTGIDVAKKLSELAGQNLPAVVITGETTPAALADIDASGLPHLAKPVAPFKLRAILLDLLRT